MAADVVQDDDGPQHLKQVSRVKHIILQKYLPSWEVILGSKNRRLCYFDCYAGPGVYEFEGQKVDGSPIIAVGGDPFDSAQGRGRAVWAVHGDVDDPEPDFGFGRSPAASNSVTSRDAPP